MTKPRKTKAGTWESIEYLGKDANGKKRYKHLTADSERELKEKQRQLRQTTTAENIDVLQMTVGQAVDTYIERRSATASPSTIRGYKSYRRSSFGRLMAVKIEDLTDALCQREIDAYANGHSPKSVALRWGLIQTAVSFYYKDFNPRVELPAIRRKRLEMPEADQLFNFFEYLEGHKLEIPVLLSATCGLRRGEIAALNFKTDVDYDKGIIRISRDMVMDENNAYVVKDHPKSDAANRAVICPQWVIEKIAAARDDPNYKMYKPNSITTGYHRHAPKFGLKCSFHGLRHYYVSVMEALGVPELYQMERLGHTTNSTTNRYKEYLKSKEVEINDSMQTYMDNLNPKQRQRKDNV